MASKLTKVVANFETQLSTKLSISGTSATLQNIADDDGVNIPDGKYYFTIDGGTGQEEHILCDNTAGSLTNIKSVSRQGVETSGAVREHRVGAEVKITDFAILKIMKDILDGDEALDSTSPLEYDSHPTFTKDTQLIDKKQLDDTAIAGAPDASTTVKGISKLSKAPASPTNPIAVGDNDDRMPSQGENDALVGSSGTPSSTNTYITEDDVKTTATADKVVRALGTGKIDNDWINFNQADIKILTAGETINGATLPVAVYQKTSDNEIYACDGNVQTALEYIGFAVSNGTDGNPINIQTKGIVSGFTGLAEGERYYVQDDKTIGTTIGTYETMVGIAISETELLIMKGSFEYIGSATDTDSSSPFAPSITTPAVARIAIVDVFKNEASGDDRDTRTQIFLTRKGMTNIAFADAIGVSFQGGTLDWTSNTITFTDAGATPSADSVSITGYFYK
jgi:hypothetical protein